MAKRPGRAPLTGVLFTCPHQPWGAISSACIALTFMPICCTDEAFASDLHAVHDSRAADSPVLLSPGMNADPVNPPLCSLEVSSRQDRTSQAAPVKAEEADASSAGPGDTHSVASTRREPSSAAVAGKLDQCSGQWDRKG